MNTGTIIDELPDAFRRMPGTITEKMTAYRKFCNDMISEIQAAYDAIPDSLNRNLAARIAILKERADRESKLAVVLAQRLHEKGDDFHSHLVFENGEWLTPPPALKDENTERLLRLYAPRTPLSCSSLAKSKFVVGQRVCISKAGVEAGMMEGHKGTVVGFGKSPTDVRVVHDGAKSYYLYHMDFLEARP